MVGIGAVSPLRLSGGMGLIRFGGRVDYANIGHSVFSDDGGHFYAGGGFKVVIGR
jgi:hypothetical protein